jgi:hypothetical protein
MTKIDGVDIHFIHVRSQHEDALPLIMTHGWPGSLIELLETIGPLTDPTKYGGTAADAFHLVLPSMPGYGFSSEPTELGWDSARMGLAWATLMERLGYTRYVAQGATRVPSSRTRWGVRAQGVARHPRQHTCAGVGHRRSTAGESEQERVAQNALATFKASGSGYLGEQSNRPQTIGYSLLDSPVGLAAWLLDHDTDSYYKISRAFVEDAPVGNLTREHIVDDITLYWLTGTGASAARWYWETGQPQVSAGAKLLRRCKCRSPSRHSPMRSGLPRAAGSKRSTRVSLLQRGERGGHFAAWEQPELFASEMRAAFKPLR